MSEFTREACENVINESIYQMTEMLEITFKRL